jgi:hypothetical protein
VVRPLAGGYTDAHVVLCDIGREPATDPIDDPNGQFILKVGFSPGRRQSDAHNSFTEGLADFASDHLPSPVFSVQGSGVSADVYDIAGFELDSLRSAEQVTDYEDREEACLRAACDLLSAQLSVAGPPDYRSTAGAVMEEWLGPGFPNNPHGSQVRELLAGFHKTDHVFRHEGELLADPLALFGAKNGLADQQLPCFRGHAHGDMHLRNILVRGSLQTGDLAYWLIDVQWADQAPLLYDHAYLELSALLYGLARSRCGRVLPLLAKLDGEMPTVPVQLDLEDTGLVNLVRTIRDGTVRILSDREPRRADVWHRQFLLARIAAGLNWAAKPLDDPALRQAALVTAAWATRLLVRRYHQDLWVDIAREDHAGDAGEGLRAWEPTYPGKKPEALRFAEQRQVAERPRAKTMQPPAPIPVEVATPTAQPKPDESPGAASEQVIQRRQIDSAMLRKLGTCRPGRGLQDYKTAIADLLNEAHSRGQTLRSLELGEALRLVFGKESYNEFRKNKLRTAVEHLWFRTIPTKSGFDVDFH